ncbi:hypothetical protein, partial [Deinococcus pimensis]|uniref:hypothetical protein n=1 Tax=Deinococcus pimensis TaxID=309888 RepID=UPI000488C9EE
MTITTITLRWVPGASDRVLVRSSLGRGEVRVRDVRRVLGRACLDDLYLRGAHTVTGSEASLWYTLVCLGVTPDDRDAVAVAGGPWGPPDLSAYAR